MMYEPEADQEKDIVTPQEERRVEIFRHTNRQIGDMVKSVDAVWLMLFAILAVFIVFAINSCNAKQTVRLDEKQMNQIVAAINQKPEHQTANAEEEKP